MKLDPLQAETAALRAEIFAHFPLTPLPKRDKIVADDDREDGVLLREHFAGRLWSEIPVSTIDRHHDNLPLFSTVGHHYYLPAFLCRALVVEGEMWNTVISYVIYDLCPNSAKAWEEQFSLFTPDQLHTIASWLVFILTNREQIECDERAGQRAYFQYWQRYVPGTF